MTALGGAADQVDVTLSPIRATPLKTLRTNVLWSDLEREGFLSLSPEKHLEVEAQ